MNWRSVDLWGALGILHYAYAGDQAHSMTKLQNPQAPESFDTPTIPSNLKRCTKMGGAKSPGQILIKRLIDFDMVQAPASRKKRDIAIAQAYSGVGSGKHHTGMGLKGSPYLKS